MKNAWRLLGRTVGFALAFVVMGAQAQAWPTKAIVFLNPFPAGGGTDTFARPIAAKLSQSLGQQVLIENQGGAGGTVGATNAARRAPDGYNWFFGAVHHTIAESLYTRLPYSLEKDFEPITVAAFVPNVVVVHPKHADKFKTLKDLIDYAHANPDKLNYGSAGSGTTHHLSVELFKTMTGTQATHVIYRGSVPALNDVVAGHIDFMFCDFASAEGMLQGGKVRPLGVTTAARIPAYKDIPPINEAGVAGYDVAAWFMVVTTGKSPQPAVERLHGELTRILAKPEIKEQLLKLSLLPMPTKSVPEMQGFVKLEIARWGKVVEQAGIAGSQ